MIIWFKLGAEKQTSWQIVKTSLWISRASDLGSLWNCHRAVVTKYGPLSPLYTANVWLPWGHSATVKF